MKPILSDLLKNLGRHINNSLPSEAFNVVDYDKPLDPAIEGSLEEGRLKQTHVTKCTDAIHIAITIIMIFSVSEIKPRGTLLEPPTHAHFNSRLSI